MIWLAAIIVLGMGLTAYACLVVSSREDDLGEMEMEDWKKEL